MSRLALVALVAGVALSGCGVSQATVTALEADLKRSREDLQDSKRLAKALGVYVRGLKTGNFNAPYSFVYLGPGDLKQAASALLPYRIPASELVAGASGEVEIVSINQPRLESRNRIRLQLTLEGKGVQGATKAAQALAGGVVADVELAVRYDEAHRFVALRPTCTAVALKQTDDGAVRLEIVESLNQRVFDRSVPVPVPPLNREPAEAVFVTGDHVVIQYPQ
ncbi:MAG: hypothetical protein QM765_27845 [Myxococcales bacterium]